MKLKTDPLDITISEEKFEKTDQVLAWLKMMIIGKDYYYGVTRPNSVSVFVSDEYRGGADSWAFFFDRLNLQRSWIKV